MDVYLDILFPLHKPNKEWQWWNSNYINYIIQFKHNEVPTLHPQKTVVNDVQSLTTPAVLSDDNVLIHNHYPSLHQTHLSLHITFQSFIPYCTQESLHAFMDFMNFLSNTKLMKLPYIRYPIPHQL